MQPQILPLTQQEKALQQVLMGMQTLTVKGESAALLNNLQENVRALLQSVIVQIEVGKQMAQQEEARKKEEERIQKETKEALGIQTEELKASENGNGINASTNRH